MVTNIFTKCKICGATIRLRYQITDIICPVQFCCPNCNTVITGKIASKECRELGGKEPIGKPVFSFDNLEETGKDVADYMLEISPDFLTLKLQKNTQEPLLTPFIRYSQLTKNEFEHTSKVRKFYESWLDMWPEIRINLDLCHNGKYDLVLTRIKKVYNEFPKELNATISTHQQLICFCSKIISGNSLRKYSKFFKHLIYLLKTRGNEVNKLLNIYDIFEIKEFERKTLQLIKNFLDNFDAFIPIFNTISIEDVNNLGISTFTFEKVRAFYQDSYELLLSYAPIIIGLNNINSRGILDNFKTGTFPFNEKVRNSGSKYNAYDILIDKDEYFSWIIGEKFYNHIRNSIGHFNYKEDPFTQEVYFTDQHQGKSTDIKRTLVEIGRDCVNMFYSLLNCLELNYSLIKILQIAELKK